MNIQQELNELVNESKKIVAELVNESKEIENEHYYSLLIEQLRFCARNNMRKCTSRFFNPSMKERLERQGLRVELESILDPSGNVITNYVIHW